MRRLAVLLALAALLLVAPVTGHAVNVAEFDAQATADGTVLVEAAFLEESGWVVLYADGSPVGHARVETAARTVNDVAVPLEPGVLDDGPVRLKPRLFADDGDGAFDPDTDRRLLLFGGGSGVPVARGDAARVLAEADGNGLPVTDGEVGIRHAALPADGHLVVRAGTGNETGTVLGSRTLAAGTHENVTVPVADEAFADGDETTVTVTVYRDDGDGALDDADEPVRVDEETVSTTVDLLQGGGNDGGEGGDGNDGDDEGDGDDPGVTTATPGRATATGGSGPGFAVGGVVVALVALAVLVGLREAERL